MLFLAEPSLQTLRGFCLFVLVLGIGNQDLTLAKHSTVEPYPLPFNFFIDFYIQFFKKMKLGMVACLQSQNSGGRDRWISGNSRSIWSMSK